jgi:hypothetical protein
MPWTDRTKRRRSGRRRVVDRGITRSHEGEMESSHRLWLLPATATTRGGGRMAALPLSPMATTMRLMCTPTSVALLLLNTERIRRTFPRASLYTKSGYLTSKKHVIELNPRKSMAWTHFQEMVNTRIPNLNSAPLPRSLLKQTKNIPQQHLQKEDTTVTYLTKYQK